MRKWIPASLLLVAGLGLVAALVGRSHHPPVPDDQAAAATPRTAFAVVVGRAGTNAGRADPPATDSASLTSADTELARLLAAVMAATDQEAGEIEAFLALVHAIGEDPALLDAVERLLAKADGDGSDTQMALKALVVVGTPEAQAVMVDLLGGRANDGDFLAHLVPNIGFVKQPTLELEAALRTFAETAPERTRYAANLAVGNLAGNVYATDPVRAGRIVNDYGRRLAKETDAGEARSHLAVLGNIGASEAAAVVQPYLEDTRGAIRAEAVESLRLVPTAIAEQQIYDVLRDDTDARVRASAAWALSYREPTSASLELQAQLLLRERNENVAMQILSNVWAGLPSDRDAVRALVTRVAQHHPLASIQERAQRLLDGSNG